MGGGSGGGVGGGGGIGGGGIGGGGAVGGGGGGASDGGTGGGGAGLTVVRVHYPTGHAMALRGSLAPLNWNTGVALNESPAETWVWSASGLTQTLELKPLLDDTTWSRGPNYQVEPGQTLDVYPHFTTTQGQWSRQWPSFHSNVLNNDRGVWLYLPPTYLENTTAHLPVLYMHDGQNLFDPSAAFGGNPWWVQNTVDAAAESGAFDELIVVGPENTADRIAEYTPTADPGNGGGNGDAYLTMLVTELKPMVDAQLRTLPDAAHTGILGSSLGGLISAYAGVKKADTFGRVGVMSPSSWWDNQVLATTLLPMTPASPRPLRVYLDSGDSGTDNDDVTDTAAVAQVYQTTLGYTEGVDFHYVVQPGGQHNETYWAQRLPGALVFLFGPRTP